MRWAFFSILLAAITAVIAYITIVNQSKFGMIAFFAAPAPFSIAANLNVFDSVIGKSIVFFTVSIPWFAFVTIPIWRNTSILGLRRNVQTILIIILWLISVPVSFIFLLPRFNLS